MVLRIHNWEKHYENSRTKQYGKLKAVLVPNNINNLGYLQIMNEPDGLELLGAWTFLLQIASQCEPRGTLWARSSYPHTSETLALLSRQSVDKFSRAIDFFIKLGWLEGCEESVQSPTKIVAVCTLNQIDKYKEKENINKSQVKGLAAINRSEEQSQERAVGAGQSRKMNIASAVQKFESAIGAVGAESATMQLVKMLQKLVPQHPELIWAAVVQARDKSNPAGYLVSSLAEPKHFVAEAALAKAKAEMKKAGWY